MIEKFRMLRAGPLTSEDPRRAPSSTRTRGGKSGSSVHTAEHDPTRVPDPLRRGLPGPGPEPPDVVLPHLHGHTDRNRARDGGRWKPHGHGGTPELRGRRRWWRPRRRPAPDDPVPQEVPALVVRLERRGPAGPGARVRLVRAADRHVPLDRRA